MSDRKIAELERRLTQEITRLRRLLTLATELNSTPNLDDLLQLIMGSAAELLGAEASSLLLHDEETGELVFRVAAGEASGEVKDLRMPATEGIAGRVLRELTPVVFNDPSGDDRVYRDVGVEVGVETRNLVAVPLLAKGGCLGVVEVINKPGGFDDSDVSTAEGLAALAAVAIENAALYARLQDALLETRLGVGNTSRSGSTGG